MTTPPATPPATPAANPPANPAVPPRHLAGGYCDLGLATDVRHAGAILNSLRASESMRGDAPDINKHQREAITKYWQFPRLPVARFTGGMPEGVLWSKEAADSWLTWTVLPKGGRKKPALTVTLDHLIPHAQLLDTIRPQLATLTPEALADLLSAHHGAGGALLCVITSGQNADINTNKWTSTNPFTHNPLLRYQRSGININAMRLPSTPPTCRCA